MTDLNSLAEILESTWVGPSPKVIMAYYQANENSSIKYGIYSSSLDRFLVLDSLDLWTVEFAAKILSSKLSTTVCVFTSSPPPFKVEDSLNWTLKDKSAVVPKRQTPELFLINSNDDMSFEGPPADFINDLDNVVKDQEFAYFVLRASYALRLAELVLNSNVSMANERQSFYTNLFKPELEQYNLETAPDKASWSTSFQNLISGILYKSMSIEESLSQFSNLYKKDDFDFRRNQSEWYRQKYFETFFELLGWKPVHA